MRVTLYSFIPSTRMILCQQKLASFLPQSIREADTGTTTRICAGKKNGCIE